VSESQKKVVVVGAGLVGAVSALLLAQNGCDVTVIEQRTLRTNDSTTDPLASRTVAMSARSRQLLEASHLWPDVSTCPIKTVHVSEQGKFGSVKIQAHKLKVDALGFVVANADFEQYLHECIRQSSAIEVIENAKLVSLDHDDDQVCVQVIKNEKQITIDADVLIAADGTHSKVRSLLNIAVKERDYNQCAVLANVATSLSHANTAYERFTGTGPLALLPMADKGMLYSMILTAAEQDIEKLTAMSDSQFLQLLQQKVGGRLGRFEMMGARQVVPLKLTISDQQSLGRCVLIGNAARTLHPVAGQGLNLALRDVFELASCLGRSCEFSEALENFSSARRFDQQLVTRQTDLLARAFTDKPFPLQLPASAARSVSMMLLDFVGPVKSSFASVNMGKHISLPR